MSDRRPSLAESVVRWPLAMVDEVLRLPEVLRQARLMLDDLGSLTTTLGETTQQLDGLLNELERTLEKVVEPLDDVLRQVASIELTTTELRNAFFAIAGRVPVARSAVRQIVSTSDRYVAQGAAGTDADPRRQDKPPPASFARRD